MSLMITPSWPAGWTEASVQLLICVLALVVIRAAGWFPFEGEGEGDNGNERIRRQALAGGALIVPSWVAAWALAPEGAVVGLGLVSLFPVLVLIPLAILLAIGGYTSGKRQRRARPLAVSAGHSLVGWSLYLVGYEALFRGTLLFALFRAAGAWPAIVITTAVYALAHLDKRAGEILGSVPMGIVWGMACLEAGGLWPALMCHVAVAVAFDRGLAAVR